MNRPRRPRRLPSSSGDADRSPSLGPSPREATDRGLLGVVRLLLVALFVCGLAITGVVAGPALVAELDAYATSVTAADPPPAGERNPDLVHPDDPTSSTYDGTHAAFTSSDVEEFVHQKVNERRAEHDLPALEWDGTVASVSRAHSVDMAGEGYLGHVNHAGEGPFDRFHTVSEYCRGYGENVAMTWVDRRVQTEHGDVERYLTPDELADGLVEGWMNSTDHRKAILEESWDRGGVGVHLTDDGQVYATHNFCMTY
ncbi:CAP domain-containing protein [Natronobiforma cellulositropha]|uniref:CAP domain-containing protein n=1 Tax=Natronobiforma cellulositropha TaxID=1679076 RepID=UPI0021D5CEF1|nr:CAP domain-containing protein [Natronobiforma cellulositropha]